MLTVGPSRTRHVFVRASAPIAAPMRSTRSTFHVAPSAEPHGAQNAVTRSPPSPGRPGPRAPVRPVGHVDLRDPDPLVCDRRPQPLSGKERGLLVERELGDEGRDVTRHGGPSGADPEASADCRSVRSGAGPRISASWHSVASRRMRFGWFGFGSGALADAEGVAEIAVAAERLGFESVWIGEHPVLIDPHESAVAAAVTLGDARPDPRAGICGGAYRAHPPWCGNRDPPVTQSGDLGQGARDDRRAVAWPADRRYRRRLRSRRVRGDGCAVQHARAPRRRICRRAARALGRGTAFVPWRLRVVRRHPVPTATGPASRATDSRQRHVDRGAAPRGRTLPRAGTASSSTSTAPAKRSTSWRTSTTRSTGRRGSGRLEVTITPPPGLIDVDTMRRFEDLGVHRLVLMRDFTDMAGAPDSSLRTAILDDMTAMAERFSLSEMETSRGGP